MTDPGQTHFYGDGSDTPHPEPGEHDWMLALLRSVLAAVDGNTEGHAEGTEWVGRDEALGVEIRNEIAPRIRDLPSLRGATR